MPRFSPQSIPPEFWDAVFKPRGPGGLFSGSTALGLIPGVGQGMSYIDTKQALREGSPLGVGLGVLGMAPGGKGASEGLDKIIDFFKYRGRKRSPEREIQLGPKGAGKDDIISNKALSAYREAVERWKAQNKLADLQGNTDLQSPMTRQDLLNPDRMQSFRDDIQSTIEGIQKLQESVQTRFQSFLRPGKLKHGNAKELQSAYKVLEEELAKGGIPIEVLEEADAVIGALDDQGAIDHTEQVIAYIENILSRKYTE